MSKVCRACHQIKSNEEFSVHDICMTCFNENEIVKRAMEVIDKNWGDYSEMASFCANIIIASASGTINDYSYINENVRQGIRLKK
jgi:hypothetical protein